MGRAPLPAATATAPSARGRWPSSGWPSARPTCCRWRTTTWSSPCRRRSGRSPITNKAVIYGLLFAAAAETLLTIAADPKHLGARIGLTLVLHTWGSALTHHPHVHGIVPGGGISLDGERWVACRRGFFLPVRVLSRLFRRLFCEKLVSRPSRRRAQVLRRARRAQRRAGVRRMARTVASNRVGGLCQASLRRPRGGARLSVALHPPRGHRQQPPDRAR